MDDTDQEKIEKELLNNIFDEEPLHVAGAFLMEMDMGTTLYVCARKQSLDRDLCTENFWKDKVGYFYGQTEKASWETWKEAAFKLYLKSQEEVVKCVGEGGRCEEEAITECSKCRAERDAQVPLCGDCSYYNSFTYFDEKGKKVFVPDF